MDLDFGGDGVLAPVDDPRVGGGLAAEVIHVEREAEVADRGPTRPAAHYEYLAVGDPLVPDAGLVVIAVVVHLDVRQPFDGKEGVEAVDGRRGIKPGRELLPEVRVVRVGQEPVSRDPVHVRGRAGAELGGLTPPQQLDRPEVVQGPGRGGVRPGGRGSVLLI
jgi:hypothetical protein